MDKKKYYINIGTGEISQLKYGDNDDFVIYADDDEILLLRRTLDRMDDASFRSFFRSHVPIIQYHHDQPNDDYDASIIVVFRMIYNLGDEQTKAHIEEMEIFGDQHMYCDAHPSFFHVRAAAFALVFQNRE